MAETKVKKTSSKESKVTKMQSDKVEKRAKASVVKKEVKVKPVKSEKVEATLPVSEDKKVNTKKADKKQNTLTISVFNTNGKESGTVALPEEIFGAKVNKVLIAQAVRVYLANQRQGNASTKTRGEVRGSTRKIYRQKGTGRARHGGIRAPIFVKGGIAHGPKPQDHSLNLPVKMRRLALFGALTAKLQDGGVKIVSGIEALEPKTKAIAASLKNLGLQNTKKKVTVLLVLPKDAETIYRSARNITGVTVMAADRLNTYEVLQSRTLLLMRDSIETMKETFLK